MPTRTITSPVWVLDYIPDANPLRASEALRAEADAVRESLGGTPSEWDVIAMQRILNWYEDALEDLPVIERVGLAEWCSGRRPAKVWATLTGLKARGVTALPL